MPPITAPTPFKNNASKYVLALLEMVRPMRNAGFDAARCYAYAGWRLGWSQSSQDRKEGVYIVQPRYDEFDKGAVNQANGSGDCLVKIWAIGSAEQGLELQRW